MTVNGCGTSLIQVQSEFDFTECCHWHDACYATCGMKKKACERRFEKCMKQRCQDDPGTTTKTKTKKDACTTQADMYLFMVNMMGCPAFQESQKEACMCSNDVAEVEQADRDRLQWLLETHDPSELTSMDALLEKYPINQRPIMFLRLFKKYPRALVVDHTKSDVMSQDEMFATTTAALKTETKDQDPVVKHIEL